MNDLSPECGKATAADARPIVHIIDADGLCRERVRALLGKLGVSTQAYVSAEDFLSRYAPHRRECIVTAASLPGLSGLALQDAMNRKAGAPPFIFISDDSNIRVAVEAMQAGAVGFMEKPIIGHVLLDYIRAALSSLASSGPEIISRPPALASHAQGRR